MSSILVAKFTEANTGRHFQTMTPGITTEKWQELLQNSNICTKECREILEQIYALGGEATCTQLSTRYVNTPSYYNMNLIQLAKRVYTQTNCPLAKTNEGEQKWWPILFVGRTALQDQPGTYSWKLRDELEDALELLSQKEVNTPVPFAKNTILYGPPGTGKTYQTVNYAVAIIEGKITGRGSDRQPRRGLGAIPAVPAGWTD